MELTLTAKVHWYPSPEEGALLRQAVEAYHQGSNGISGVASDKPNSILRPTDPCGHSLACDPRWRNR